MTDAPPLSRQTLYDRVWARPLATAARELGLSASGLGKICDRLLIPYPPRGHWAKVRAGRADPPPPLPPGPPGAEEAIIISADRAPSRRRRTRYSPEARREQLIDAAAELIAAEGLPAATMKAVARKVGVSEAQAHNYFHRRGDLLLALARRELHAMETHRRAELSRGHDRYTRVTLSTVTYLREAAQRGVLIQMLTQSAEVREGLKAERQVRRRWDTRRVAADLEQQYGLPPDLAYGSTAVLTALTRRAGRLLAAGKLSLESVERLTLAMVTAGNRALARAYRPPPGEEAT
ncbi:TetR/AcrR family transcriptional regulator [Phenylobacterium aquaticum]|uniref:TetR/AcrR family transcriptional regulator n=1 Tax=Phenylobacterium aquaticum TaxID=1763816 RepID=UPI001F5CED3B|nr:TetR/AcrR family transcriptional regulator [Phenylobacterium aquaticum]MCI3131888.1 TetR family transcriptional regulator [Phenylobacterium aquaticum]